VGTCLESGQLRSRAFSADLITRTKPSGNDSGARLARPCLACRGQGLMRRISAGQRQRRRTLVPLHRPAEGLLSRVPPLLASAHGLRERRWLGLGRPRRLRASATAVPGRPTGVFTGLSWSLHVRHRGLSVPRRELHPPARPSLYGHARRALLFALDLTPLRGWVRTMCCRSACAAGPSSASWCRQ
jgi:hypothetical protein